MNQLMRWEPFSDLRQAMDRAVEESMRPLSVLRGIGEIANMPLDVYQTPTELVVEAAISGVKPEDVEITITGDTLTISAESKAEEEVKKADYLYRERRYGSSTRTIMLPKSLKTDKAEATFEHGVLKLTIPKAEEAKPKQIKVKAKGLIESKKVEPKKEEGKKG
jgi:HSP20 family protein